MIIFTENPGHLTSPERVAPSYFALVAWSSNAFSDSNLPARTSGNPGKVYYKWFQQFNWQRKSPENALILTFAQWEKEPPLPFGRELGERVFWNSATTSH
jgi:hypothetical protein